MIRPYCRTCCNKGVHAYFRQKKFAWRPVTTIERKRKWLCFVHKVWRRFYFPDGVPGGEPYFYYEEIKND